MSFKRGHQLATLVILLVVFGVFFFLGSDIRLGITGFTFVEGNESTVSTTGVSSLSILVNSSALNTSVNYTGVLDVEFFDSGNILAKVPFDFDFSVLNLSNVTIETTASAIAVNGITASKTVYVGKLNTDKVCIKDVDGASIASITGSCTGPFEVLVTCDGTVQSGYVCSSFNSTTFEVSGLTSSAVSSLLLDVVSVVPNKLGQGANLTLSISGEGFSAATVVSFDNPDVVIINQTFVDSSMIRAYVYVKGNSTLGNVSATVTDVGNATLIDALEVSDGPFSLNYSAVLPPLSEKDKEIQVSIIVPLGVNVDNNTLSIAADKVIFIGPDVFETNLTFVELTQYFARFNATVNLSTIGNYSAIFNFTYNQTIDCVGCTNFTLASTTPNFVTQGTANSFIVVDKDDSFFFPGATVLTFPVPLSFTTAATVAPYITVLSVSALLITKALFVPTLMFVSGPGPCGAAFPVFPGPPVPFVSGPFTPCAGGPSLSPVTIAFPFLGPGESITFTDLEIDTLAIPPPPPAGDRPPTGGGKPTESKPGPVCFYFENPSTREFVNCGYCISERTPDTHAVLPITASKAVLYSQITDFGGKPYTRPVGSQAVAGSFKYSSATSSEAFTGKVINEVDLTGLTQKESRYYKPNKIKEIPYGDVLDASGLPVGTTYGKSFDQPAPISHDTTFEINPDVSSPTLTRNGLPTDFDKVGPDCEGPTPPPEEFPMPPPGPTCTIVNGERVFSVSVPSAPGEYDDVSASSYEFSAGFAKRESFAALGDDVAGELDACIPPEPEPGLPLPEPIFCTWAFLHIHCLKAGGYEEHWWPTPPPPTCPDYVIPKNCPPAGTPASSQTGQPNSGPIGSFPSGTYSSPFGGSTPGYNVPQIILQDIRNCCIKRGLCGNGKPDPGEQCEPPNVGFCGSNCQYVISAACGDGKVDANEQCDDGNTALCDGCSPVCVLESCGDGWVCGAEACEPPNTQACDASCQLVPQPSCGNSIVDANEQCDDGNTRNGDGCSSRCLLEVCGNRILDPGEQCDDGNHVSGDGCSSSCVIERCGNKVVEVGEECEPPNTAACDAKCKRLVPPRCGDRILDSGEDCDPSGQQSQCSTGKTCVDCSCTPVKPYCGDGNVDASEQCDPSGQQSQCSTGKTCVDCQCAVVPQTCGDSVLDSGEVCDPPGVQGQCQANQMCNNACRCVQAAVCGNRIKEVGEGCDPSGQQSQCTAGQTCSNCQCTPVSYCGDGTVDSNEQCDPPGKQSVCKTGYACGSGCICQPVIPVCGNNVKETGEACDGSDASACAGQCKSDCACSDTKIKGDPTDQPALPPTITPPKMPDIVNPRTKETLSPDKEEPEDTCVYSKEDILLERLDGVDESLLPSGKEFAFGLRAMNSGGGIYDITAAISEIFGTDETEVLKCSKSNGGYKCAAIEKTLGKAAGCAGFSYNELLYEQMSQRRETLESDELPKFTSVKKTLIAGDRVVEQSGYRLELTGALGSFGIGPVTRALTQPPNPYMAILNAMEVEVPDSEQPVPATVTLPLPKPLPNIIDKYTIRLYVWNVNEWTYLESIPDLPFGTISAQVPDLRPFAIDGKVYFAVIGATCHACVESKFDLVYDGGGEKAVVLVHGLTSSGIGTWAPLIKEIETAKLPVQVYTFSYPAWRTLDYISKDLADAMETLSYKYKIFPVGHSIGGLVVEHALFTSHLEREQDPSKYKYLDAVKNGAVILLGTPNKGSPAGDVWKNLFAYIAQVRIPETAFNLNSPLLKIAVSGIDIPPVPYLRYFVIAGTKPLEFNLGFFTITTEEFVEFFSPNDGMIPVESAYTLATSEFNDPCDNYFEMHLSHIELNDHEIARRIIERIINQQFRDAAPLEEPWPGYSKYVNFKGQGWQEDDLFLIVSKPTDGVQGAMAGCNCGDIICGEDESIFTCPTDCFVREVKTVCAVAPGWVYLLLALSILIFLVHVVRRRMKKEESKWAHIVMWLSLGIALLLVLLMILICKVLPLWVLLAILAMILFTTIEARLGNHHEKAPVPPPPPKPKKAVTRKSAHGHAEGDYDMIMKESKDLLRKLK